MRSETPRVALGILPLSHGFGLVLTHAEILRGNTTVLHTNFNMQLMLKSVEDHHIERMYLVSKCPQNKPVRYEIAYGAEQLTIFKGASSGSCSGKQPYPLQNVRPFLDSRNRHGCSCMQRQSFQEDVCITTYVEASCRLW